MEVKIIKGKGNFHFVAENGSTSFPVRASEELSKTTNGFRPMELLLSSLGSCMSIDILNILYKQKQVITTYEVKITGNRTEGIPSIFKDIVIEIFISGKVEAEKIEKAIALSTDKYCSVYHIVSKTAAIKCLYYLNQNEH